MTTLVSQYQKGKTILNFTEARDSEWQWHQLGHMQICTLLQTDNHASTLPHSFLQAGCPSGHTTNSVKALKAMPTQPKISRKLFSVAVTKRCKEKQNMILLSDSYNHQSQYLTLNINYKEARTQIHNVNYTEINLVKQFLIITVKCCKILCQNTVPDDN